MRVAADDSRSDEEAIAAYGMRNTPPPAMAFFVCVTHVKEARSP
jgi:hypothetical protein